jgi:hypothetical protein
VLAPRWFVTPIAGVVATGRRRIALDPFDKPLAGTIVHGPLVFLKKPHE